MWDFNSVLFNGFEAFDALDAFDAFGPARSSEDPLAKAVG